MLSLHIKLFYYITSLSICQVLFSSFFKSFRDVRYCLSYSNFYIISLLFKFVKYFFKFFQIFFSVIPWLSLPFFSASAFLLYHFQTSLSIPFPKFFQAPVGFLSFSPDKLSLNSRISLPRSTALLLYHLLLRLSRKKLRRYFSLFCLFCTVPKSLTLTLCCYFYLFMNCFIVLFPPVDTYA